MKDIFLLRHGETEFNRLGIIQGCGVDLSLNHRGKEQAQQFYDAYREVGFQLLISSHLKRSIETLVPFSSLLIPTKRISQIGEINWGVHEGRKMEAWMEESYRNLVEAWSSDNFDARLEGGESVKELAERLGWFLEYLQGRKEEKILICSHGRTMRCLLCLMCGEHLREMEKYEHHNAGFYRILLKNGAYEIIDHNNTAHLNGQVKNNYS